MHSEHDLVAALPDIVIAKLSKKMSTKARPAAASKPAPGQSRWHDEGFASRRKPQLATLAAGIPTGGEWLCKIKFDGYRLRACIEGGKVALVTRGGHDWRAVSLAQNSGPFPVGASKAGRWSRRTPGSELW